jgi:serine protease AprX
MQQRGLYTLALSLLLQVTFSQNPFMPPKADPELWMEIMEKGEAEMLVVLREQADLSAAHNIPKKNDKGRFVLETCSALAAATQGPVRDIIRARGANMQSFWIINAVWTKGDGDLVWQLSQLDAVDRIEANPVQRISKVTNPEDAIPSAQDRALTSQNWGLAKIKATNVWALGHTGAGVVVGGQDTGYEWAHPAIKAKYRGWDGSTANHNYNWHDAIHTIIGGGTNSCGLNLTTPCDDDNHGTHTMGTMVGGPNMDSIYGVAPDATWIGCRNMEEGDGTPSTYIECFEWFIAPTDLTGLLSTAVPAMAPHVINNSWGCPTSEGCNSGNFGTMNTVVNNVRAAGILVVVSAGNSGSACSTVNTPAAIYEGSFSVGATGNTTGDQIASFSSRGPVTVWGSGLKKPNISAPGVGIPSCIGNSNTTSTYTYAAFSGTSMAGPHVAGVAALMMSARPDMKGQVETMESIMETTATNRFAFSPFCGGDNSSTDPNNFYGHGRIDALAAVNAAVAAPVEFVSFFAKKQGDDALLRWLTASAYDCTHFEVQRSRDALRWEKIGEQTCINSNNATNYAYTDEKPGKGLFYYRLKQYDRDDEYMYSNAVSVGFSASGIGLRLVARPDEQDLFCAIAGGDKDDEWQLGLYSASGALLATSPVRNNGTVAMPDLPAAIYFVLLRDAAGRVVATEKLLW